MDKEKLVLLVVGVVLVVSLIQAFQLSGLVREFQDAASQQGTALAQAAAGSPVASGQAPLSIAKPAANTMVGGC